jgi:hypothetical protein
MAKELEKTLHELAVLLKRQKAQEAELAKLGESIKAKKDELAKDLAKRPEQPAA